MAVDLRLGTSTEVLRQHAKSFFWAWLFLPKRARPMVAHLYAICRTIDDISDESSPTEAKHNLLRLKSDLESGEFEPIRQLESKGLQRKWFSDLFDGALFDTQFRPFQSERELEHYCYRVAGVVGLMMCPLLGVRQKNAYQNAVDLGSAMQLTNIARDIAEDARRGRVYLPVPWLQEALCKPIQEKYLRSAEGLERLFSEVDCKPLVERLLQKADRYYESGLQGLGQIPWRTRISISVAAEIYRDIGRSLARQDYNPFRGRAYVSKRRKIFLSFKALWRALTARQKIQRSENESSNLTWTLGRPATRSESVREPHL